MKRSAPFTSLAERCIASLAIRFSAKCNVLPCCRPQVIMMDRSEMFVILNWRGGRFHPKVHSLLQWCWRWAGMPGSVIQAFVVLQTQTLNMIRCWWDNDTVRLVFCTYQANVFTINIMGKTRKHHSVGCLFQRELECACHMLVCVCMHVLVPPIIRQPAPAHTHTEAALKRWRL